MIQTFAQSWLEEFWHTGKHKRVPSELAARLLRKLDMLNRAASRKDFQATPSNQLHALQWRPRGPMGYLGQWFLEIMFSL
jgi:proteic killer suppression protein